MTGLIIFLHVLICVLLITIILIQRGRGGGLVESFSDMESMFGTKTNAFLTRTTTILSALFFITCLVLAFISAQQAKSMIPDVVPQTTKAQAPEQPKPQNAEQEAPKPEAK